MQFWDNTTPFYMYWQLVERKYMNSYIGQSGVATEPNTKIVIFSPSTHYNEVIPFQNHI